MADRLQKIETVTTNLDQYVMIKMLVIRVLNIKL